MAAVCLSFSRHAVYDTNKSLGNDYNCKGLRNTIRARYFIMIMLIIAIVGWVTSSLLSTSITVKVRTEKM